MVKIMIPKYAKTNSVAIGSTAKKVPATKISKTPSAIKVETLESNPEKANDWEIAYTILTVFTRTGMFTGVKLNDFLNAKETDFYNARKVINGLDKAAQIEVYAKEYLPLFV